MSGVAQSAAETKGLKPVPLSATGNSLEFLKAIESSPKGYSRGSHHWALTGWKNIPEFGGICLNHPKLHLGRAVALCFSPNVKQESARNLPRLAERLRSWLNPILVKKFHKLHQTELQTGLHRRINSVARWCTSSRNQRYSRLEKVHKLWIFT